MVKGNSEKAPAESQQVRVTQTPTEEEIARRAYQRYQARGGAGGSAEEDWQAAEQELRDELNGSTGISNHPPQEEMREQAALPPRGDRRQ